MPVQQKNAFHMTYVSPISRPEPMEYAFQEISDSAAYSKLNEVVISASSYIETVHQDVSIFMQQTQCLFSFGSWMMYEN